MGIWDNIKDGARYVFPLQGNPFKDDKKRESEYGEVDRGGNVGRESAGASRFGQGGERAYTQLGNESAAVRHRLGQIANGQESISAEQLRQGLQQNIAGQSAMAAGARPQNAAMAARTASMNAARAGSGMAGQQAMAGIAERQAATQSLGNMLTAQRQQELQAALGGRGMALQGYGQNEDARTSRYSADMGVEPGKSADEKYLSAGMGAASLYAMSDRRLKTKIGDGEKDADDFLKSLKAYRFDYKDEKHGKGARVGIMAQDLERTKAGKQAVVETSEGKAVHGAHLATALASVLPGLDQRLSKLEGSK